MDSENSIDQVLEISQDEDFRWSVLDTKLLVSERIKMESEFRQGKRKKLVLWQIVLNNIKRINPNFKFSREQIIKKFNNLLGTYQRIKQRNKKTGRSATLWEFWETFDETYGSRASFNPPGNTLINTFNTEENQNDTRHSVDEDMEEARTSEDTPPLKKRNRAPNEILEFLKTESKKDDERFEKLLEVEKENLQELKELKEVLKSVLDNS